MLEVSFVRSQGSRDRVYVKRDDGSSTSWEFPSYGDGLPHDLCHLVVEDTLSTGEPPSPQEPPGRQLVCRADLADSVLAAIKELAQ